MDTDLEAGRKAYREEAWRRAFELLHSADRKASLDPEDLELLGRSAYMLGADTEYVDALERAHRGWLDRGEVARAARCGFWIGHSFVFRGDKTRGAGWFARAQRLLENIDHDCVERGYLLIPVWLERMGRGDFEGGHAAAVDAMEIGERFGDADLVWLARGDQARALMQLGRMAEGLRLVDEALVITVAGELSPIVTGIVYCNTIAFCRSAHQIRHVREWTRALTTWCDRQPEMIAHNALCLVHRAEILLLVGEWEAALQEAHRSEERFSRGVLNQIARGKAFYCQGEVRRLHGDFDAAEEAYTQASRHGCEPQPGLALMRLAQGRADLAVAAIRRVISETTRPLRRAEILPAYVEIMLATGNTDSARAASHELDEIATTHECEAIVAMSAGCRGAVALAESRASEALVELRQALVVWKELGATCEVARLRVLVGLACRALGDLDGAALELSAALGTFEELGAEPDRARVAALADAGEAQGKPDSAHGLTTRELQVLRLVATGRSNREIADQLFISEHTVARHLQNIFAKLDVSSRAAATAFAFSHELV